MKKSRATHQRGNPSDRPAIEQSQLVLGIAGGWVILCSMFTLSAIALSLSGWQTNLWFAIGSLLASVASWIITFILGNRVRRACLLQIWFVVAGMICQLPLWGMGIGLATAALGVNSWIMIVAALVSSATGFAIGYLGKLRQLRKLRDHNDFSKRLDVDKGIWDMRIPLDGGGDVKTDVKQSYIVIAARGVGLFAPLIGQFFARQGDQANVFYAFVVFAIAYLITTFISRPVALATELVWLEAKIGKRILVPAN